MNPLTIKQIEQIAREHNVHFEVDEISLYPVISSGSILLKPSIQYAAKYDGWKMTGNNYQTDMQVKKMTDLKNLLNGTGINE